MRDAIRYKLHGRYSTPRYRVGQWVECQARGELLIVATSAGRIPWPVGRLKGGRSLVVYAGLARALRRESIQAVAYWWGVSRKTVGKWRRQLGIVHEQTAGTAELRSAWLKTPAGKRIQRLAWAKARDPERRRKIGAARVGYHTPRRPSQR